MPGERRPVDLAPYVQRSLEGPCFICALARGTPDRPHHIVYEDEGAVAWLGIFQVLRGYTLVAPRAHREHVAGDFASDEYVALQRVVQLVGEGVRAAVPTERLYVLSLGSRQGNSHVHWHIAPLPPGVPYEEQQLAALDVERRGVLDLDEEDLAALAMRIREEVANAARRLGHPNPPPTASIATKSARVGAETAPRA